MKRILIIATLSIAALSQTAMNQTMHPAVDHHTHLSSAAATVLNLDEPQPTVTLPPDLDRVLRDYERFRLLAEPPGFASLFTDDGLFPSPNGWLRGRDAIRTSAGIASTNLRVRATAYSVDGAVGYLAGFFRLGNDPSGPDISRFLFALHRGMDGKWLIAAHQAADFRPVDRKPRTAERLITELDAAGINPHFSQVMAECDLGS